VEWVEVTGKTVEEAKELALDQLGVAEGDAEIHILAEAKTGLFGRVRSEARVRARVAPSGPRPKRSRGSRDRSSSGNRGGRESRSGSSGGRTESTRAPSNRPDDNGAPTAEGASEERAPGSTPRKRNRSRGKGQQSRQREGGADAQGAPERANGRDSGSNGPTSKEAVEMAEGMTLQEQADIGKQFLEGLVGAFGLEAEVSTRVVDDETVELAADGSDLGLLVGPRGATLAALQDVTRTVVQRHFPARTDRILVDVAGYRQRRSAALQRFSEQLAQEVIDSGAERSLEPMSPADRKIVHDAVNGIDGVATRSEGEDPARYIVIAPAS
jgi:spoIIIJ-associated protein